MAHDTKQLLPNINGAPRPLDVAPRVADLVRAVGDDLVILGNGLRVPPAERAEVLCPKYRTAITQRFARRRPHADEMTWRKFVRSLRGMLSNRNEVRRDTLPQILSLIDSL